MTEFPRTPEAATSEDERPWTDLEPADDTDLIDDHVLTDAAERDVIDQRREVPIDDPDDDR